MKSEDYELKRMIDQADRLMQKIVRHLDERNDIRSLRMSQLQREFCDPLQAELVEEEIPPIDMSKLEYGDQKTPGTVLWYMVHKGHCCVEHGCKYGNPDCPVANRKIKQSGACETCGLESEGYFDRGGY